MAKFLVGTTALMGHIAPLAPIVADLVRRGHEVCWYTGMYFQEQVEKTGAMYFPSRFAADDSYIPVNSRFPERAHLTGIESLLFDIRHLFAAESVGHYQDLQNILQDFPADIVLTDTGFLAGGWLYELDGLPWAVFNPFAVNLSGTHIPPFGLGYQPPATRIERVRYALRRSISWRNLYRDTTEFVDRLRGRVGLSETGQIFWDRSLSPYLYMQGSIKGLEYPREDLPPQFHFIGPSISATAPTPFEPPRWWTDLNLYRRAVLVTQGTLSTTPEQLVLPAVRALARRNALVIATSGDTPAEELRALGLPRNCRVVDYIPFQQVLPHMDVMVTNGGYNGVQLALSHGVPLVVAGTTEDKLEVNARVRWSGAGIDLGTANPKPGAIGRAILSILTESRYRERAKELSREFQAHNGATTGATLLETLARTRRPVFRKR